jgi:hypothetical protein
LAEAQKVVAAAAAAVLRVDAVRGLSWETSSSSAVEFDQIGIVDFA